MDAVSARAFALPAIAITGVLFPFGRGAGYALFGFPPLPAFSPGHAPLVNAQRAALNLQPISFAPPLEIAIVLQAQLGGAPRMFFAGVAIPPN